MYVYDRSSNVWVLRIMNFGYSHHPLVLGLGVCGECQVRVRASCIYHNFGIFLLEQKTRFCIFHYFILMQFCLLNTNIIFILGGEKYFLRNLQFCCGLFSLAKA